MLSRSLVTMCALLLDVCLCNAQQDSTSYPRADQFKSPDGMLVVVIQTTKAPEATRESRIEVKTRTGRLLAKLDYGSKDGEHGYGVSKAVWTPDSQFFVFSLESSGGHSAWHSPVQFFSRKYNKITSLDDALNDAVMNPQFLVAAPDHVTVELWFSKQTKTVSLGHLRRP